jgi:hypothetical protein
MENVERDLRVFEREKKLRKNVIKMAYEDYLNDPDVHQIFCLISMGVEVVEDGLPNVIFDERHDVRIKPACALHISGIPTLTLSANSSAFGVLEFNDNGVIDFGFTIQGVSHDIKVFSTSIISIQGVDKDGVLLRYMGFPVAVPDVNAPSPYHTRPKLTVV